MDVSIQRASPLQGTLSLPPDKAICHRAVLAAALATGTTDIRPWPSADDCQRTLELVERLGVSVTRSASAVRIEGRGREALRAPADDLFCGDSGTTLRLAAGLLAGQPFEARLSTSPSLSRRPMRRIVEPLTAMGAHLEGREGLGVGDASNPQEVYPPLRVHGRRPLRGMRYEMPVASAQVKSAILFAGLAAEGPTTIIEREPTRDHTERMLAAFGARVRSENRQIVLEPGELRSPGMIVLPGDFSSAAFFLVAASCVPGSRVTIEGVGLNPTRVKLLDVLTRMGGRLSATVSGDGWEPRGAVAAEARPLRAISVEPGEVPGLIDELPILMVAAACADGTTRFQGVGELRVKETDRVSSLVAGLRRLGARITLPAPDVVEIQGGSLRGGIVESAGDHRTAMSLVVAGLIAQGSTTVQGVECVAKSFPDFFGHLRRLVASSTVKTINFASSLARLGMKSREGGRNPERL